VVAVGWGRLVPGEVGLAVLGGDVRIADRSQRVGWGHRDGGVLKNAQGALSRHETHLLLQLFVFLCLIPLFLSLNYYVPFPTTSFSTRFQSFSVLNSCSPIATQVNVHVYEASRRTSGYKRISCFDAPGAKRTIHLLYCGGVHYNALVV